MIGCGGSGVSTVRYLRKSAKEALAKVGWDGPFPQAWQFIGVDIGVQYPSDPFETEQIPDSDYICVGRGVSYRDIQSFMEARHFPSRPGFVEMLGWKPSAVEINPPVTTSAGMHRSVGRMAGLATLMPQLSHRLIQAYAAIRSGAEEFNQTSKLLTKYEHELNSEDMEPLVIVVGSMAGGTGSAIMLDINELVQRINTEFTLMFNVVYSAEIFESVGASHSPGLHANSLAFMSELLAFTWNGRKSSDLIEHREKKELITPPLTFIVEGTNLSGQQISNSHKDSFQQIASWLSGVAISPDEQLLLMWAGERHEPHSLMTSGGYGFEKSSIYAPPGAIYSLGRAKLSVGRDRFPEYASKLLQRETIDFLLNGEGADTKSKFKSQSEQISALSLKSDAENLLQSFLVGAKMSVSSELEKHFIESALRAIDTKSLSELTKLELEKEIEGEKENGVDQENSLKKGIQRVENHNLQSSVNVISTELRELKNHVLDGISGEICRSFQTSSIPAVNEILRIVQQLINQVASQIRIKAANQIRKSELELNESFEIFEQKKSKGFIPNNDADKSYLDIAVNSIISRIESQCLDYLSVALEELASNELAEFVRRLGNTVAILQSKFEMMADWPKIDEVVPYWLRTSPYEFCLESSDTWPDSLRTLIADTKAPNAFTDEYLIRIARTSILMGGYESCDGESRGPLFELVVNLVQDFDLQSIESRVEDWLRRRGAGFEAFVHEGLQSYLADNFWTNEKSSDYEQRLQRYAEVLNAVLEASQPLIQVNEKLAEEVYGNFDRAIKAYPYFQLPFFGHAADDILKGAMVKRFPELQIDSLHRYSGGEGSNSSFCFTSMLRNPINPSIFKSFTNTQAALFNSRMSTAGMWSYVGKFRRTRKLSEYIPLPTELRHAAIRGFAVGRILGFITVDTNEAIKISGMDRVYSFPRWLLTTAEPRNLLPALLESMSLCFAAVPIHGQEAFGAYRELISLGTGSGGSPSSFEFDNECLKYITTGSRLRTPVDAKRVEMMTAKTSSERQYKMIAYLNDNLNRYEEVLAQIGGHQQIQSISAADKLTIELIDDLISNYQIVLESIRRYIDETCIDYF